MPARIRTARAAWQAGLFSGLVSGIVVYGFGVIMTLSTLPILASRSDYRAQFAHSHAPNIATYLVGDILAAVGAHLIINLVLGADRRRPGCADHPAHSPGTRHCLTSSRVSRTAGVVGQR